MAYAGDVTARQAWEQLSKDRRAVLVDARTRRPNGAMSHSRPISALGKTS